MSGSTNIKYRYIISSFNGGLAGTNNLKQAQLYSNAYMVIDCVEGHILGTEEHPQTIPLKEAGELKAGDLPDDSDW
jgi:hypothetical protein